MSLFNIDKNLFRTILEAKNLCDHPKEEEGGVIMEKDGDYQFVKITNKNKGTTLAYGLYEADEQEVASIIFPLVKQGWKMYSSYHTHPSFSAEPSNLDMEKLFKGFKYNVIYARPEEMFSLFEWLDDSSVIAYVPAASIEAHAK